MITMKTVLTNNKTIAAAAVLTLGLTGCASTLTNGMQEVNVKALSSGQPVTADCTLKNDKGTWNVTSPGAVAVHRSAGDMSVECHNNDTAGSVTEVSKANSSMFGNILAGGLIGAAIDHANGSGFDYAKDIVVNMVSAVKNALN